MEVEAGDVREYVFCERVGVRGRTHSESDDGDVIGSVGLLGDSSCDHHSARRVLRVGASDRHPCGVSILGLLDLAVLEGLERSHPVFELVRGVEVVGLYHVDQHSSRQRGVDQLVVLTRHPRPSTRDDGTEVPTLGRCRRWRRGDRVLVLDRRDRRRRGRSGGW